MIPRWLVRLVIAVALMATISLSASVVLWLDARDSRSAQAQSICESRNKERKVHREILDGQIEQTANLPAQLFEQFGVTRTEALGRLMSAKRKLHRLDCSP